MLGPFLSSSEAAGKEMGECGAGKGARGHNRRLRLEVVGPGKRE